MVDKKNDNNCIFCKIVTGEVPCQQVYSDTTVLAFEDINPSAKIHVVVIPKTHYTSFSTLRPTDDYVVGHLFSVAGKIANLLDVVTSGYRIVVNQGSDAGQEIDHFHYHILGGQKLHNL
ncbi:MAG: histidine triad nucleotide-binding protein [SAR202 cluster bacterium]|jgi:histidine triad (HIT) family protein|nr:histidine triad nucleotide-binding protein [Chloroflexota bacterium]MDP6425371.1 histidine triad nucleotide-binding protein [Dehalococcoidia bacterium]MDP7613543.1 histidine triad nucleotide-binding protein [Dehalococcoidia bacterium]MQG47115.1 histidine triad nucleotide-binding protein [SAR202 cluster bacterium]|tara:strand:+ start:290 stop:646 length:357 start_codon:yes stop_codon:yes gene_type:complete